MSAPRLPHLLSLLAIIFVGSGLCLNAATITISGTVTSNAGPFVAGQPFEVTFGISPGTVEHWTAGTGFSPASWSNDYSLGTQVVSSLSSPSILTGTVSGVADQMTFANLSVSDDTPASFSLGVTVEFFAADLGDGWYLRGVSLGSNDLPLTYPASYIAPTAYLDLIAGTYDSGLSETFLALTIWNGFTSGATVAVDQVIIVPEPSALTLTAALGIFWVLGAYRRR